jgi:hypothetical protein
MSIDVIHFDIHVIIYVHFSHQMCQRRHFNKVERMNSKRAFKDFGGQLCCRPKAKNYECIKLIIRAFNRAALHKLVSVS